MKRITLIIMCILASSQNVNSFSFNQANMPSQQTATRALSAVVKLAAAGLVSYDSYGNFKEAIDTIAHDAQNAPSCDGILLGMAIGAIVIHHVGLSGLQDLTAILTKNSLQEHHPIQLDSLTVWNVYKLVAGALCSSTTVSAVIGIAQEDSINKTALITALTAAGASIYTCSHGAYSLYKSIQARLKKQNA